MEFLIITYFDFLYTSGSLALFVAIFGKRDRIDLVSSFLKRLSLRYGRIVVFGISGRNRDSSYRGDGE